MPSQSLFFPKAGKLRAKQNGKKIFNRVKESSLKIMQSPLRGKPVTSKQSLRNSKVRNLFNLLPFTSHLFGKTGKKFLGLAHPILRMHPSSLQKDPRITGYLAVMTRQDHPKVNNPVNLKQRMPSSRDSMFPSKQLRMKTSLMHQAV